MLHGGRSVDGLNVQLASCCSRKSLCPTRKDARNISANLGGSAQAWLSSPCCCRRGWATSRAAA